MNYKKCKDSIKALLLPSIESLSAKYDLTKGVVNNDHVGCWDGKDLHGLPKPVVTF